MGDEGKGKSSTCSLHASISCPLPGRPQRGAHGVCERHEARAGLIPSGCCTPGSRVIGNGVVVDPQRLSPRWTSSPAAASRLATASWSATRRTSSCRTKRSGPSGGGAPRRAQDWHHVARHRPGLRGQDRAARHQGRRLADPKSLEQNVRDNVLPETIWCTTRRWTGSRCSSSSWRTVSGCALGPRRVADAEPGVRAGKSIPLKARKAHCSTSITGPIHTSVVERVDWRRRTG